MAKFYIGNRLTHSEMTKAVGHGVGRLNQRMAETLRSVAMEQGIKKSQKGLRLEFYAVNKEELDTLLNESTATLLALKDGIEWRPLITVDSDAMTQAIQTVNSKPEYTRGMDYKTHNKYLAELKQAVKDSVVKVNEDKQIARASQDALGANPYKVGDLLTYRKWKYHKDEWYNKYSMIRVAKVTNAYVWLEVLAHKHPEVRNNVWSNGESAKLWFDDVKTYGDSGQWAPHGLFIPLKGNEDDFEWLPITQYGGKLVKQRWDKVAPYEDNFGINNNAEVGYCYHYEPSYD